MQDVRQQGARLGGVQRPARDGDLATGDHGGREEGGGVGQIGLDRDLLRARHPGLDQPLAVAGPFDADATAAQRLDRHVDVGEARQVSARVHKMQTHIETWCCQQQP